MSVLTLSCIALDRWYAICHPLMFKSTAKRARNSIVIIWIVSCIIMIPQAIVMECSTMLPGLANKTTLFTVCDERWGGKFIVVHEPILIRHLQMEHLVGMALVKRALCILLAFVNRVLQKHKKQVEMQNNVPESLHVS